MKSCQGATVRGSRRLIRSSNPQTDLLILIRPLRERAAGTLASSMPGKSLTGIPFKTSDGVCLYLTCTTRAVELKSAELRDEFEERGGVWPAVYNSSLRGSRLVPSSSTVTSIIHELSLRSSCRMVGRFNLQQLQVMLESVMDKVGLGRRSVGLSAEALVAAHGGAHALLEDGMIPKGSTLHTFLCELARQQRPNNMEFSTRRSRRRGGPAEDGPAEDDPGPVLSNSSSGVPCPTGTIDLGKFDSTTLKQTAANPTKHDELLAVLKGVHGERDDAILLPVMLRTALLQRKIPLPSHKLTTLLINGNPKNARRYAVVVFAHAMMLWRLFELSRCDFDSCLLPHGLPFHLLGEWLEACHSSVNVAEVMQVRIR